MVLLSGVIDSEVKSSAIGLIMMVNQTLSDVADEYIEKCIDLIISHKNSRIVVMGAGRSGLVGKAFALRLLHLGYEVHVLGETLMPPVMEDNLVIAISGSGTTKLVITAVEAAKNVGAKIIAITSYPESQLGRLADFVLKVKGRVIPTEGVDKRDYFARQILGIHEPLAPLGTLFEDTCMLLLDAIVIVMMDRLKLNEDWLKKRHANIE